MKVDPSPSSLPKTRDVATVRETDRNQVVRAAVPPARISPSFSPLLSGLPAPGFQIFSRRPVWDLALPTVRTHARFPIRLPTKVLKPGLTSRFSFSTPPTSSKGTLPV